MIRLSQDQAPTLRVLHITSELGLTGASAYIRLIATRLGDLGYDSLLVTGVGDFDADALREHLKDLPRAPIILPELKSSFSLRDDLRAIRRIEAIILDFKPHIVHTHKLKGGFVGRLAARNRVPVIVHTYHGHPFDREYNAVQHFLMRWVERIGARFSHKVITFTGSLRDDIAQKYRIASRQRVLVLPLGIDLAPFARTPRGLGVFRQQHGIALDVPLIGVVGKLTSIKNHRLFFDAALQVRRAYPSARFVVAGDGDLRAELESYVGAQGLAESVIFVGWVEDLPTLYSDLDVVVVSSKSEGVPTSILEGLAAGCKVVSTNVGAASHLLKDGQLGLLVESGDAAGLAEATLEQLQSAGDVSRDTVRAWVAHEYGVDRKVRELDSLYRGLLHKETGVRYDARSTSTGEFPIVKVEKESRG